MCVFFKTAPVFSILSPTFGTGKSLGCVKVYNGDEKRNTRISERSILVYESLIRRGRKLGVRFYCNFFRLAVVFVVKNGV